MCCNLDISVSRLVGKVIWGDLYFHVSAIKEIAEADRDVMYEALEIVKLRPSLDFNVVKIGRGRDNVSLLSYSEFLSDAFPSLEKVCTVNLATKSARNRSYKSGGNPPVLHKKEMLLSPDHPSRPKFERLTETLESIGIRPAKPGLGFKKQWTEYLAKQNVEIINHQLKEVDNVRD